jgi:hypothetical protein
MVSMFHDNADLELVARTIMDDLDGMMKSQTVRLAAQLQLADLVKDGPKNLTDLARATGTHRSSLYNLLQALVACGYFQEIEPETFAQTQKSYLQRTDIPNSLHDFTLLLGERWLWESWFDAQHTIKTGEAASLKTLGKDVWQYFREDDPEAGKRFHQAMSSLSTLYNLAIARSYDFSSASTIVDVAGGQGRLLATILQMYPTVHSTLFDQPPVIELAIQDNFLDIHKNRVAFVGGDFFEAVPSGADIYILKQVIHNWQDSESIKILSNCRKAMQPNGRVLVIDEVMAPGQKPAVALLGLHMRILNGSHKRSEAEHHPLFEASGLKLIKVWPTNSTYSILEAVAL